MANEIQADYTSGSTLYAVIRNRGGQVWCGAEQTFEDWGTDGHTADNYDLALTDKTASRYVGDVDPNVPPGRYCIQVFVQAGAAPADTDTLVSSQDVAWTGTGELTAATILANKAVQHKVNGTIDYYDDDGQTVILTHALQDEASTVTRTPN